MLPFLHTLWQADSAFPSGSFAFSYGVEGLAAMGAVTDRASLASLVAMILRDRWTTFDRVALMRAFRAGGDVPAIARIDDEVQVSTFGEAMRNGSRRNGMSFLTTMSAVGNQVALTLKDAIRRGQCRGHIAVMQGAVWPSLGLDEQQAQMASAYITSNGIASAAVRLGVVTSLQAQSVISETLPLIDALLTQPVRVESPLSSFAPLLDVASARQEEASLRLFAN